MLQFSLLVGLLTPQSEGKVFVLPQSILTPVAIEFNSFTAFILSSCVFVIAIHAVFIAKSFSPSI